MATFDESAKKRILARAQDFRAYVTQDFIDYYWDRPATDETRASMLRQIGAIERELDKLKGTI